MLEGIFLTVVNMSIIGSLAIILILAVRLLLLKAPKVFSYCLWAVVLFRLLVPFSFDSVVSLIPINKQPVPLNLVSMQTPAINTGITRVDEAVSSALPSATNVDGTSLLPQMITIMESIWLAVMLAMVVYGLYSLFKLKHKLSSALFIEGNIYQSEYVDTPFVLGIIKPKIYLPVGLNETEREYILLHEQNHIRRGDHIIRIISYLTLCIHWFNPLVWIAFRTSGKDMEMANDESVIRKKGDSIKKAYSSSLLALSTGKRGISPVPLAFGEEDPKSRIHNIINYKKPVMWVMIAAIIVVASVSVGLLLSTNNDTENGNQINLDDMNAQEILEVLNNQGYPNDSASIYTDMGSSSGYPWSIEGCTSAAEFWIPNGTQGGESMGLIEVYDTINACTARRESFEFLTSAYDPYDYLIQEGKVFIQVPLILSKTAVTQYKSALQAMAQGKTPEPYTPQQDSTDPGKDPDSNGGTEAPLISSFNKVLVNETGEGVGDTHVMSSSESAEFLTIMLEKNWTVIDDFPARDLDAIFTISNNDDDYIFVDGTLYEGKTVILMKYNQDSQGIVYLAPAEVLNALIEFKAGLEAN